MGRTSVSAADPPTGGRGHLLPGILDTPARNGLNAVGEVLSFDKRSLVSGSGDKQTGPVRGSDKKGRPNV